MPKAWEDPMGVGKVLLGPKAQEVEHGTFWGGGGFERANAGEPQPVLDLQWPPSLRRHPRLCLSTCMFV